MARGSQGALGEGKGAGTQGHSPSRETNMKVRQAIPVTSELADIGKLAKFDGERSWSGGVRAGEAVRFGVLTALPPFGRFLL